MGSHRCAASLTIDGETHTFVGDSPIDVIYNMSMSLGGVAAMAIGVPVLLHSKPVSMKGATEKTRAEAAVAWKYLKRALWDYKKAVHKAADETDE